MISPKELREKADRLFLKVVSSELKNESLFPLLIPGNKKLGGENYNAWRDDLVPLYQQSKQQRGEGYSVDWKERKVAGISQRVPVKIYFESLADFLFFTQRKQVYNTIVSAYHALIEAFPTMEGWGLNHLSVMQEYQAEWQDILAVCRYFAKHPPPRPYYLRELPIEVHSKFIEQNSGILRKMLDALLSADWVQVHENDFSARYFLKPARVLTQIRALDETLKPFLGYDDCAVSLDEAAWLQWKPKRVFIIENKACFLSFPATENAVAIFGEGFKSRLNQHFTWISEAELYCWFDLDAAGFEILNLVREHYTHAQSLMMDNLTFQQFSKWAVPNTHRRKQLNRLTEVELSVYDYLLLNRTRLEQERIPQRYVKETIIRL